MPRPCRRSPRGTLARIRKLFSLRRRLHHHLSTVAGLSAFLVGVNIFLTPREGPWARSSRCSRWAFPWRFIMQPWREPAADACAASWRRPAWKTSRRRCRVPAASRVQARSRPAHAPLLAEAVELRETILGELQVGGAEAERWRSDLQPELDAYTEHIGALLQARRDLERAEARVSAAEVTQELAALRGKLEDASSPELRREYQTAVEQYEGQLKTLQDLQERMEMIDLRAKSAVLALQQLSLDIPRLRAAPTGESAALVSLRDKAQELTHYLEDLRAGHRDLEQAGIRGQ